MPKINTQKIRQSSFLIITIASFSICTVVGAILSLQNNNTKTASASYICDNGLSSSSICLINRPQKQAYRCNGSDTLQNINCVGSNYTYHANENYTNKCPDGFNSQNNQCSKPATKSCPNGGSIQGDLCVE